MRMPGLVGAAGGDTRLSEAANRGRNVSPSDQGGENTGDIQPIPFADDTLGFDGALVSVGVSAAVGCSSALIVEVDVDRPNPLVRGARCVSLSSVRSVSTVGHKLRMGWEFSRKWVHTFR